MQKSFKSMKSVHSRKEMRCLGNVNSNRFGNLAVEWYGSVCETGELFMVLNQVSSTYLIAYKHYLRYISGILHFTGTDL